MIGRAASAVNSVDGDPERRGSEIDPARSAADRERGHLVGARIDAHDMAAVARRPDGSATDGDPERVAVDLVGARDGASGEDRPG